MCYQLIKPYNFTLDAKVKNNTTRIECVAGDTETYQFNINLTDDSLPVSLGNEVVRLVCRKADKTTVFQDFAIVDAPLGKISIILSTQTIAVPGNVDCELKIYGQNSSLTIARFNFKVVESLLNESTVESSNEFSALAEALTAVEDAVESVPTIEALNVVLQDNIDTAIMKKEGLENVITTADLTNVVLKGNIDTAITKKEGLENVITTADLTNVVLKGNIDTAITKKEDLENVIATADLTTYTGKGEFDAYKVDNTSKLALKADITYVDELGKSGVITIAPYDSLQKSAAKIVLNGQNDSEIINGIIDSLSNGGKLLFLDGTINLSGAGSSILLKNNIAIEGCGAATCFSLTDDVVGFTQYANAETLYNVRLKDFLIQGDKLTVPATQTVGVKISPQESILEGIKVIGCKTGINLDGGFTNAKSLMNFVYKCYFLSNSSKGLVLGTDSSVTQCLIGDNGNPEIENEDYDSCGIHVVGWGNNIENNHFYKNNFGIRNEWAVGNIISNNMFESGYREDILFAGRAHMNKVSGNAFMGKDRIAPYDWSEFNCISFAGAPSGEGSQRNSITGNTLTYYITEVLPKTHYNYFVAEVENCDNNTIANNILNGFYKQAEPILKVGVNTQVVGNI